jgi:hypothetical protein
MSFVLYQKLSQTSLVVGFHYLLVYWIKSLFGEAVVSFSNYIGQYCVFQVSISNGMDAHQRRGCRTFDRLDIIPTTCVTGAVPFSFLIQFKETGLNCYACFALGWSSVCLILKFWFELLYWES